MNGKSTNIRLKHGLGNWSLRIGEGDCDWRIIAGPFVRHSSSARLAGGRPVCVYDWQVSPKRAVSGLRKQTTIRRLFCLRDNKWTATATSAWMAPTLIHFQSVRRGSHCLCTVSQIDSSGTEGCLLCFARVTRSTPLSVKVSCSWKKSVINSEEN